MTVTYHIAVKKVNQKFLQDLQEKYAHTNAELEITVHPNKSVDAQLEIVFWKLIDLLDWSHVGDDESVILPVVQKLAAMPVRYCYTFQDILSEKLYYLDGLVYAQHIGDYSYEEGGYFSVDAFLYARCCVVANGQETYEMVRKNPVEMPKDITFEPLLSIAAKAYRLKTGKAFDYVPTYNYETFSNKMAWE